MARSLFLILFFSFVTLSQSLFSQGTNGLLTNYDPPSPEASAIAKFVEHPVSNFTGTPEIKIPLFEVKTGRITLPISLNYHASGVKINDIASRVGTGWTLIAGGIITQTIKGIPDGASAYGAYTQQGYNVTGGNQPVNDADFNNTDFEPDLYFYKFANRSGKFYLINGEANIVNRDPIKFSFPTSGGIAFTDDDGLIYTFSDYELTNNIQSSWYLTGIYDPISGNSVSFFYRDDMPTLYYDVTKNNSQSICVNGSGLSFQRSTLTRAKVLQKITYNGGVIEFKADKGRNDFSGDKAYTEINQYTTDNGAKILKKGFIFNYYETQVPGQYAENFRLYLESVKEKGSNGSLLPPYSFFYKNRDQLPPRQSVQQDIWGYYNASGESGDLSQFPRIYVNYGGYFEASRGSCLPFDNIPHDVTTIVPGLNRNTNASTVDYGTLTKIVYPTKGFTTYDYESHEFANFQTGGIRIKKISDFSSEGSLLQSKQYTYSGGFLGGPYPQVGFPLLDGGYPGYDVGYHPNPGTIIRFNNNQSILGSSQGSYVGYANVSISQLGSFSDNGVVSYTYSTDKDVPGNFTVLANGCSALNALNQIRANSYFPFFEMESREQRRGLLLSEEYKDSNNNSIKRTSYNYQLISDSPVSVNSWYIALNTSGQNPIAFVKLNQVRHLNMEKEVLTSKTVSLNKGNVGNGDVHSVITDYTNYTYSDVPRNGQYLKSETHYTGTPTPGPSYQEDYQYLRANCSTTTYNYPFDYNSATSNGVMGAMVAMNYINPVISTITTRTTSVGSYGSGTFYTGAKLTNYSFFNNGSNQYYLPSQEYQLKLPNVATKLETNNNPYYNLIEVPDPSNPGSLYEKKIEYLNYDQFGNPTTIVHDGKYTLLNWGDTGDRLYLKTVASNSVGTDGFRTSYDYDDLDRLKMVKDANNRAETYEYDAFGRLATVRDKNGHILKSYCYNYAGQNVGCRLPNQQEIYVRLERTNHNTYNGPDGYGGTAYSTGDTYTIAFYTNANYDTPLTLTTAMTIFIDESEYYSSNNGPLSQNNYSNQYLVPAGVSSYSLGQLQTEYDDSNNGFLFNSYYTYTLYNNGNYNIQ